MAALVSTSEALRNMKDQEMAAIEKAARARLMVAEGFTESAEDAAWFEANPIASSAPYEDGDREDLCGP